MLFGAFFFLHSTTGTMINFDTDENPLHTTAFIFLCILYGAARGK